MHRGLLSSESAVCHDDELTMASDGSLHRYRRRRRVKHRHRLTSLARHVISNIYASAIRSDPETDMSSSSPPSGKYLASSGRFLSSVRLVSNKSLYRQENKGQGSQTTRLVPL